MSALWWWIKIDGRQAGDNQTPFEYDSIRRWEVCRPVDAAADDTG